MAPVLVKRPRCPHDGTLLIRLVYYKVEEGKRGPVTAPWFICPKDPQRHIFPETGGGE